MGILQMLSADWKDKAGECRLRYQRTPGKKRPSEANVMYVLQRRILSFLEKYAEKEIASLIEQFQRFPSIGPKSAQRLAFYLLKLPQQFC